MKDNKSIIYISLATVLLLVVGFFATRNYEKDVDVGSNTISGDTAQVSDSTVSETTNPTEVKDEDTNQETVYENPGVFIDYSEELLTQSEGDVVLFFSANWCPTCRALEADLMKNKEMIPTDLTILRLEYQQFRDLESKYNVTYQHTLVKVDNSGELINKWSGGNTLESVLENI